jgi:hypothetical protein
MDGGFKLGRRRIKRPKRERNAAATKLIADIGG